MPDPRNKGHDATVAFTKCSSGHEAVVLPSDAGYVYGKGKDSDKIVSGVGVNEFYANLFSE